MSPHPLGGDEDGQTPLDADDAQYLTPAYAGITTRAELNDAEADNITDALLWLGDQTVTPADLLSQWFLRDLHRRMFGEVWSWAGQPRRRETTIGVAPAQIPERLQILLGDASYWVDHQTYPAPEIGIRFHHLLVSVHPFVNGNGRHARLAAGTLASALGAQLSWGARSGLPVTEARLRYLSALREADRGDYTALIEIATH